MICRKPNGRLAYQAVMVFSSGARLPFELVKPSRFIDVPTWDENAYGRRRLERTREWDSDGRRIFREVVE